MIETLRQLSSVCSEARADLVDHFETLDGAGHPALFELPAAIEMSREFREFHPLATALELVFLDDENTSNYHAYITRGPLAGSILHLSHDGTTRVVFASLADYRSAVLAANQHDGHLRELHPQEFVKVGDQKAVAERIETLDAEGEEDELLVLIASWNLKPRPLLERLVKHTNFYVAEAAGDAIANSGDAKLLPAAETLSKHEHPQAANAGKRAIKALQKTPRKKS